jgi:hypothetical protein
MSLFPEDEQSLHAAYLAQKDPITIDFGASPKKPQGITHIFRFEDAEKAFRRQEALMYPCDAHSTTDRKEHKLIWVGLPATVELAAFIPTVDLNWVEQVKHHYAQRDFYVPLMDVATGEIIFSEDEYHQIRKDTI